MPNYKLTLSYDGSRYNGWQKQGNTDNTIQQRLETLLTRLLAQPVEVAGSGRTDAGVHARMQVCSFRADTELSPAELLEGIRRYLPDDIAAESLELAPPRFHARLNCRRKSYVYRIWNSAEPNVFERKYLYFFPQALDADAMRRAAALLCGTHDYTAFCANRHMKKSAVRTVESIDIERIGGELRLTLTGDGFLYNMVRIIAGTLIEVGSGRRRAEEMPDILDSLDRGRAGFTAPPQGLFLWNVEY